VVVDDDQAKQPVGIITEADIVQAVAAGKDVNDVRISCGRVPAGWRWIASTSAQRSIRDPCLDTCPRITLVSDSWCRGVSPAQLASCPGLPNRVMGSARPSWPAARACRTG
jgi:hypothetical protein